MRGNSPKSAFSDIAAERQLLGEAARAGGALALEMRAQGVKKLNKEDGSPVTEADLAVNALLRWDYRVGATAFLVYSRTTGERGLLAGERPAHGLAPRGLATGPTTDTVLLKWTWYWAA